MFDLGEPLAAFGPAVPPADILDPWLLPGRVVCTMRPDLTPKLIGASQPNIDGSRDKAVGAGRSSKRDNGTTGVEILARGVVRALGSQSSAPGGST